MKLKENLEQEEEGLIETWVVPSGLTVYSVRFDAGPL